MAVPKGKVSKQRKRTRNSANFKVAAPTLVECPKCHAFKQPHMVCKNCGTYDNRVVIETEDKNNK
ncbi:MAG: 50S ribosomal protein L32 [Clostridia bacterium]|nr:50S ribosomal protein L32 [Clostridia bacterium]